MRSPLTGLLNLTLKVRKNASIAYFRTWCARGEFPGSARSITRRCMGATWASKQTLCESGQFHRCLSSCTPRGWRYWKRWKKGHMAELLWRSKPWSQSNEEWRFMKKIQRWSRTFSNGHEADLNVSVGTVGRQSVSINPMNGHHLLHHMLKTGSATAAM